MDRPVYAMQAEAISQLSVVGVFPSLANSFGGVQLSGAEAWEAVMRRVGEPHAHALYYEAGSSKLKAAFRAATSRKKPHVLLVWHLNLLKLLPVLDCSAARVVLFLHGIEAWHKHDPLTRFLLGKVNLFVSNTDYTWHRFLCFNPEFETAVHQTIHLGTGSTGPTPEPSETPAVLMIGRLDRREDYKGHREIIDAWPGVVARIPGAQLWIAGDGDLRPDLEQLARDRGHNGSVRFHGQVSDAEKQRLIAQCRCVAMPSRGEGFGLVYVEGMRLGRPCLVSHLDAGREVVNPPEAGLAADPESPGELAEALSRMLTAGSEWDQWSVAARARYESRFTAAHFQRRLEMALVAS